MVNPVHGHTRWSRYGIRMTCRVTKFCPPSSGDATPNGPALNRLGRCGCGGSRKPDTLGCQCCLVCCTKACHAVGPNTRASPFGSLESRTPTTSGRLSATSTQSPFAPLRVDLRHTAPTRLLTVVNLFSQHAYNLICFVRVKYPSPGLPTASYVSVPPALSSQRAPSAPSSQARSGALTGAPAATAAHAVACSPGSLRMSSKTTAPGLQSVRRGQAARVTSPRSGDTGLCGPGAAHRLVRTAGSQARRQDALVEHLVDPVHGS